MGLPNRRHHFVPDFLLKHWIGPDRKLTYFQWRSDGVLHTDRCGSRGAGYEEHLYSQNYPSGHKDTSVERDVLTALIDTPSAPVHVKLLNGELDSLKTTERETWARFLVAQLVRVPSMVQYLRDAGRHLLLADIENLDPPDEIKEQLGNLTLQQYLETSAAWQLDNASTRALEHVIKSSQLNEVFLQAHWAVHTIERSNLDLVIGDRPLLLEGQMTETFLFMLPLSPTVLFFAANDYEIVRNIAAHNQSDVVCTINMESIAVADKYVYATDTRQMAMVDQYLRKPSEPDDRHIVSGLNAALVEKISAR
ncbi:DUF4238 domain-containing protein [Ralstonia wenshanensis]|uniref:DUF4238 domain-containing protein n=1 Tax=Ralstonia wenshanensis TaxID=2842456 RepID=UPI001E63D98C|nr:DUF4238 domain-containing protein [Ralstonia wenshanensis]UGS91263.1 DUF4238 domain-containing protein [Ralstonia wenshanensis]